MAAEIWDAAGRLPPVLSSIVIRLFTLPKIDRVEPLGLTLAMVDAAQRNGVTFPFWGHTRGILPECQLNKSVGRLMNRPYYKIMDWLVVAAGRFSSIARDSIFPPFDCI